VNKQFFENRDLPDPTMFSWSARPAALAHHLQIPRTTGDPTCYESRDDVDELVRAGDGISLIAYGAVQQVVDAVLSPFASSQPGIFVQNSPVEWPVFQGGLVALVWVSLATASGGYDLTCTRNLVRSLVACTIPWLGSAALLLGASALLQSLVGVGPGASEAEISFALGTATVVGAWRFVCANALPPMDS
jgi:hypothetical protein